MASPSTHRVTNASDVRAGNAVSPNRALVGVPLRNVVLESFTPAVADADGIAASQDVTAVAAAFLINGALASGGAVVFDVPRNVVGAWTGTAIITITGKDVYGQTLVETSASGTSHTGKKAFKSISRVSTNADITAATVGSGVLLGLSYVPAVGGFVRGILNENTADAGTYAAPIRTTSTGTTADVRGTYAYAGTANGTNIFTVMYVAVNGPNDTDGYGIAQFAG